VAGQLVAARYRCRNPDWHTKGSTAKIAGCPARYLRTFNRCTCTRPEQRQWRQPTWLRAAAGQCRRLPAAGRRAAGLASTCGQLQRCRVSGSAQAGPFTFGGGGVWGDREPNASPCACCRRISGPIRGTQASGGAGSAEEPGSSHRGGCSTCLGRGQQQQQQQRWPDALLTCRIATGAQRQPTCPQLCAAAAAAAHRHPPPPPACRWWWPLGSRCA
jgi:hypothetical protein